MEDADTSEVIDWNIFNQILEMDEDPKERDFSKSIIENYFEQAQSTFADMDSALAQGDLGKVAQLGHFLKGSSASLGLVKVQNICEDIQHLNGSDRSGAADLIAHARAEYGAVHKLLSQFFAEGGGAAIS